MLSKRPISKAVKVKEALNNVSEAVRARQKSAKKRSLLIVNEHFEPFFNNALTTQVIIQRFLKNFTGLIIGHSDD